MKTSTSSFFLLAPEWYPELLPHTPTSDWENQSHLPTSWNLELSLFSPNRPDNKILFSNTLRLTLWFLQGLDNDLIQTLADGLILEQSSFLDPCLHISLSLLNW